MARARKPKVGIWAGASPGKSKEISAGLRRLGELGFESVVPTKVRRNWTKAESKARSFLAGTDADKVDSFVELWQDPALTTLFLVRGGYGTQRLLPALEKRLRRPVDTKRVWGFSDITSLQNWLWGRFGTPWVHSPMLSSPSFLKPSPQETRQWNAHLDPFREQEVMEHPLKITHRPKETRAKLRGPLLGGNLASFVSLLGTRFEPKPRRPYFFFIEEVEEYPRRIDRWLQQLSASRFFAKCQGVVLGHLTHCGESREIVRLWAKEHGVLLVEGLKAGHEAPNFPVAMGIDAELELQKNGVARLGVPILPFE